MFGRALRRVQARSLCPPPACNVIVSAARSQHEKGWNGSQQSNNSNGRGQRHSRRLPLRSTAVAGVSGMLAGAVTSDDSGKPLPPTHAFRDPSGWDVLNSNHSITMDYVMKVRQALHTNSIEEARSAQFDFTRSYMELALHGDIIDEGSLPSDLVFGAGRHAAKEDTKVFWIPSPELGKRSVLCLSVHYDVSGGNRASILLDKALEAGVFERLLEKFKEDGRIYLHLHFPAGFYTARLDRHSIVEILERKESMSSI